MIRGTTPMLCLVALLALTTTRRNAYAFSRNSIRTNLPDATAVTTPLNEHRRKPLLARNSNNEEDDDSSSLVALQNRKQALRSISSALVGAVGLASLAPPSARAFDKSFPDELADNDETSSVGVLIGQRSNSQQRQQRARETKRQLDQNLASFSVRTDALPSLTWGLALFFAAGSRSNPVATPLANVFYDPEQEPWLRDRNNGLFAELPLPLLGGILGLCLLLGTVTQYALLQLSDGDSGVCGQLAGVALINGGFFELARIASGEKKLTKDENDRAVQLEDEFDEFATKRLISGGNCHRSDVTKAFRRYFAKYRNADSEQYPLTDREIEKLLREWNKTRNPNGRAEMSSSGFYYGIQVNKDADVFV